MKTHLPRILGVIVALVGTSIIGKAASEYGSNSSNVNIPDNGGWAYSTINISGAPAGATITSIEVNFDIKHSYSADLIVDLDVGTYSNSARLWNREGGSSDNPFRTTTTSEFNGLPVNNTWYLYARDYEAGDAGYIDRWTVTIYYDAADPTTYTITPNPATVDEGAGTLTFTISRSGGKPAETIYASTTTTEGYSNNGDYTGILNQPIYFSDGETSDPVTVNITDDATLESSERFGLIVQRNSSDPVSTYLAKSTFTITDNDEPLPTIYTITPNPATVDEGAGTLTFTITRSGGKPAETIYASTTTTEGYSNNGDYTGILNQPIYFSDGETSDPVTVNITDDATLESSERFGLIVQRNSSDPVSTYLAKSTFTITDNDEPLPTIYTITPNPATVDEGAGTLTFTITRSGGKPAETIYASTTTTEGYSNNGDYSGILNQPIYFSDGETSDPVTVNITDDATLESSERFGLIVQRNSSDPVSTYLAKSTFTITDNDEPLPTIYTITPNPATVDEGAGTLTFTITRSGGKPAETIYASTTTTEGYSNNGDYTGILNRAVSFGSNQTSRTVTVLIANDTIVETTESFGFIVQRNASDPVATYLAKRAFTITDNDEQPPTAYTITPNPATVDEGAGTLTFTITRLGGKPAETVYVSTTTTEGYPNNGDYTGIVNQAVGFGSNQTSRTVTVLIANDTIVETTETFGFIVQRNASDPVSTYLAKGTLTIVDDDGGGPSNSAFTGKFTWIWRLPETINAANIESGGAVTDTGSLLDYIKSKGFKGVIFKAGQGNHLYPASEPFSASLVNLCHQKGLEVYGYHYIYGGAYDPFWMEFTSVTTETNISLQILATGCDGLIIDWETEFRDVGADFGATPAANAQQYGQGIRAVFPDAFIAHAPIWNPNLNYPIIYQAFNTFCDVVMPQAYCAVGSTASYVANASGATMAARLDAAWSQVYAVWPANAIKPICPVLWAVGKGDPNSTTFTTSAQISEFVDTLKGFAATTSPGGYQGVSFWAAEFHIAEIWDGFSGISVGPTGGALNGPHITSITKAGSTCTLTVTTKADASYTLEYRTSLSGTTWTAIETRTGTGSEITLSHAGAFGPSGFYRVREQ